MTSVETADSVLPKSTLFCPACSHRSPTDGDWIVTVDGTQELTVCPDCGHTIDERPQDSHVWELTVQPPLASIGSLIGTAISHLHSATTDRVFNTS